MYFLKLNQRFNLLAEDYHKQGFQASYSKNINYYQTQVTAELEEFFPEKYRGQFVPLVMEIYNNLRPHVDNGIKVSLNFYITTSNCRTQFYDVVEDKPIYITGDRGGRVYSKETLREAGSFIAEDGDAWLLDVTKPHSVDSLDSNLSKRLAVCYQSTFYTFEDTVEILKEAGYIN